MKNSRLLVGIVASALGLVFLAGCVTRTVYVERRVPAPATTGTATPGTDDSIVVQSEPPPLREEVITVSPGPDFFWVGGYWYWRNGWVWIGGHWDHRPRPGAIWVAPVWEHHPHGWIYSHGHWR